MRSIVVFSCVLRATTALAAGCDPAAITHMAERFAAHYVAHDLGALDKEKPFRESIQIVIEPSLAGDVQVGEFSTLSQVETWLKASESEVTAREPLRLQWCKQGLCVFEPLEGISHNTRYVYRIGYGCSDGIPYLKYVVMLDGD